MFGDLINFINDELKDLRQENRAYSINGIQIQAKIEQLERLIKFVDDNHSGKKEVMEPPAGWGYNEE